MVCYQFLINCLSTVTEAMREGLPKFSELDVLHSMNDVMESYAKLLDAFRHRFSPGPGSV
jgi:hypothetical protein